METSASPKARRDEVLRAYGRQRRTEAGRRQGQRDRDHAPVGELLAVVPRRRAPRGAGGLHRGQGLHGDPAVRLRHLGADPAGLRQAVQGDRARQRVLPAVHSRQPAEQGEGARRGLHAAGRVGHQGRRRGARRAARDPSDLGSHHRHAATPSGSSPGAICPSSSTSGPTSSAGRKSRGPSCGRPSSSGRKDTPRTRRRTKRRRRR